MSSESEGPALADRSFRCGSISGPEAWDNHGDTVKLKSMVLDRVPAGDHKDAEFPQNLDMVRHKFNTTTKRGDSRVLLLVMVLFHTVVTLLLLSHMRGDGRV